MPFSRVQNRFKMDEKHALVQENTLGSPRKKNKA